MKCKIGWCEKAASVGAVLTVPCKDVGIGRMIVRAQMALCEEHFLIISLDPFWLIDVADMATYEKEIAGPKMVVDWPAVRLEGSWLY